MSEVKSLLQGKADELRQTRKDLDEAMGISIDAARTVELWRQKLAEAESQAFDANALTTAIRMKLNKDIDFMADLLEQARL